MRKWNLIIVPCLVLIALQSSYALRYRVKKGETLWGISKKFGVKISTLKRLNRIRGPLKAGQILKIPDRRKRTSRFKWYRVRKGDNLTRIARRFGTTVKNIKRINHLKTSRIKAGQLLKVPVRRTKRFIAHRRKRKRRKRSVYHRTRHTRLKAVLRWPANGRKIKRSHGVEILIEEGKTVRASGEGVVVFTGEIRGFGKTVIVRHPNGLFTVYAYNKEILTREGKKVRCGEILARSGKSIQTRKPSLFFAVRKGESYIDPFRVCR